MDLFFHNNARNIHFPNRGSRLILIASGQLASRAALVIYASRMLHEIGKTDYRGTVSVEVTFFPTSRDPSKQLANTETHAPTGDVKEGVADCLDSCPEGKGDYRRICTPRSRTVRSPLLRGRARGPETDGPLRHDCSVWYQAFKICCAS